MTINYLHFRWLGLGLTHSVAAQLNVDEQNGFHLETSSWVPVYRGFTGIRHYEALRLDFSLYLQTFTERVPP